MFNYKQCLVFGALLLVSFSFAAAAECEGCLGDKLVEEFKSFEEKEHCWFNNKHHYLLRFKLQLLDSVTEQLSKLHDSMNAKVADDCKTQVELKACGAEDKDQQGSCHIANIKALTQNYRDMESCSGSALDLPQLDLVAHMMFGIMSGWKQIHTTC